MAWRPPYHPQLGHTTWGTLAAPQRGQRLRDGASSFQAEARRLRLLALEVFFLGTAMAINLGEWEGAAGDAVRRAQDRRR